MAVYSNIPQLIDRLRAKTAELAPESPALKEAFIRIGLFVSTMVKVEIRRQGIIDSGRLYNSIRYEFFRKGSRVGIQAGSFNVKYAAMNEYGGTVSDRMRRAMFASMRSRGGGKTSSKGVIVGNRWRPRPYLRPGFRKSRGFVLDTLRAAIALAKRGG